MFGVFFFFYICYWLQCRLLTPDFFDRHYARKIKLAEFGIKKSGSKSYLENPKDKPGNPEV